MDFSVEFYVTVAGACPVQAFLDELETSDPAEAARVRRTYDLRDNWAETYHIIQEGGDMSG